MEIRTDIRSKKRIKKPYYCYSCEKVGNCILAIPEKNEEEAVYCHNCGSDFIQIGDFKNIVKPEAVPTYTPNPGSALYMPIPASEPH